jgi:YHS domain-containing protein
MSTRLALVAAVGLLALAGCNNAQKSETGAAARSGSEAAITQTAGKPVNTMCPIGGHDANAQLTRTYKGTTVAFCCEGCTDEFDKGTDAFKADIVAKAAGAAR